MPIIETDAAKARKQLLSFIERIEETRVIHLYEFLKGEIEQDDENMTYSDEFLSGLDKDYKEYQKGAKTYTREEVEEHTDQLLKSLGD